MRPELTVRPARSEDLERLMDIYAAARSFMAHHGNPHQWGDGYPRRELVAEDVALGRSYVIEGEDGAVHATFFFAPGPDPTYQVIQNGAWPDDAPYGVIHRVAGDGQVRGVLAAAVAFARTRCGRIRMDTHADNTVMQRALEKNGFTRCGIIRLENGDPRIAYQLTM